MKMESNVISKIERLITLLKQEEEILKNRINQDSLNNSHTFAYTNCLRECRVNLESLLGKNYY